MKYACILITYTASFAPHLISFFVLSFISSSSCELYCCCQYSIYAVFQKTKQKHKKLVRTFLRSSMLEPKSQLIHNSEANRRYHVRPSTVVVFFSKVLVHCLFVQTTMLNSCFGFLLIHSAAMTILKANCFPLQYILCIRPALRQHSIRREYR